MGTVPAHSFRMEDGLLQRLKRLQATLDRVRAEAAERLKAAVDPNHPLNQWPQIERRSAPRPS